jgi:hypothetical protein
LSWFSGLEGVPTDDMLVWSSQKREGVESGTIPSVWTSYTIIDVF